MLVCSAVDFYGTGDVFNEPKSHFVARVMGMLGYDAVAVGEMDLGYGIDKLADDVRSVGLNVTCANIVTRAGRRPVAADTPSGRRGLKAAEAHGTVFPPYLIVEKDGLRFGIFGLLSPGTITRQGRASVGEETQSDVDALSWSITDPRAAAMKIIGEVDKKCDVVVMLAHMEPSEAEALLVDLPQVDIAIIGHNTGTGTTGNKPPVIGNAHVLRATSRGQYVGEAHMTIGRRGGVKVVRNRAHFLGASYEDDEETLALLTEFDDENRRQQKLLYAREQIRGKGRMSASNIYYGVGSCQSCHNEEFSVYAHTAHAHAYTTLSAQFVHRDTNCVGCHVTGYEQPGGFTGMRLRNAEVDLIDVQCEACHGPGVEHRRDGSYRAIAIASCVKCHTKNEDPDFDFTSDWEKIRH